MSFLQSKAFWGVFLKLFVGSIYYYVSNMITKTCGYASYYDPLAPTSAPTGKVRCQNGETQFKKTFFVSTVVFGSMCLAMLYFVFFRMKHADPKTYNRRMILLMFIPSILECVAFCLGIYAQSIMTLSLSMIMKGAKVIFSAIFTVTFLKRKQYLFHWFSVGFCLLGLAVAGTSEYLNANGNAGYIILGCSLLIASECMKAFHVIYDEKMLKSYKCDTMFVVGMEGIYSIIFLVPTLFLAWLVIPGKDGGSLENLEDTFYRISNSNILTVLLSILPIVVVVLAIAGVMIIKYLTGVHNALISVLRSVVAWALELILYYSLPAYLADQYGVPWERYSALKLVGFVMVILATLMYDETLKMRRFFRYPDSEAKVSLERSDKISSVDQE